LIPSPKASAEGGIVLTKLVAIAFPRYIALRLSVLVEEVRIRVTAECEARRRLR
jgi:hypothetical protein